MPSIQPSLVIGSMYPQNLSEFYAFATNGDLQSGINIDHYLVVHPNGMKIQIYRPSKKRPRPLDGQATALCLQRSASEHPLLSLKDWIKSLVSMGAVLLEQPRVEPFGAESWLTDPEGNYFLILVPRI